LTITFSVPGNSAGPFTSPRIKFLIHTTEGTSIEGAVGAYRANNSWPHDTVDFMFGHNYRICHHLSYDVAARSLRNKPGGVQTNTAGVIQVEVVGFATRPDQIDWRAFAIDYLGPRCRQLNIPIQSTVTWVAYPASFGESAPQRLSGAAWLVYRGVLGHEHATENDHGDPGAIPITLILAAAQGQAPPPPPPPPPSPLQEDADMYLLFHPEPSWWQIGPGKVAIQISGNAFDRMKKTSATDLNGLPSFALNADDCDFIINALNGPPAEEPPPVDADPNS
jgi:hypothetical protein